MDDCAVHSINFVITPRMASVRSYLGTRESNTPFTVVQLVPGRYTVRSDNVALVRYPSS